MFVIDLSVMQTTWRERNRQTRIKSAKEALDKNPEYVHTHIHTSVTALLIQEP